MTATLSIELLQELHKCLNSTKRKVLEESYEEIRRAEKVRVLVDVCCVPDGTEEPSLQINYQLRSFCAVLLRKELTDFLVDDPESYVNHLSRFFAYFRTHLDEMNAYREFGRSMSQVFAATFLFKDDHIDDLLKLMTQFLIECLEDIRNPQIVLIGLDIFEWNSGAFDEYLSELIERLDAALANILKNHGTELGVHCARVIVSFVKYYEGKIEYIGQVTQTAIPTYIEKISLNIMNEAMTRTLLDLVEDEFEIVKGFVGQIGEIAIVGIQSGSITDEVHCILIEVLADLATGWPNEFNESFSSFIPTILADLLNVITRSTSQFQLDEWEEIDDPNDEVDPNSIFVTAETALDRISTSIGGDIIWPVINRLVWPALTEINGKSEPLDDWTKKYASLLAIGVVGEGCLNLMEGSLKEILIHIIRSAESHSEPRVRYALCNTVGQMCEDFSPAIQIDFHDLICPLLIKYICDPSSLRVRTHAVCALGNFVQSCPKYILGLYIHEMASTLLAAVQLGFEMLKTSDRRLLLDNSLSTMSRLTEQSSNLMASSYSVFIQTFHQILNEINRELNSAVDSDTDRIDGLKMIRGRVLECITLLGLAVGKETFMRDNTEVINFLLNEESNVKEDTSNVEVNFLINCWSRLCSLLGSDFSKFIPKLLPIAISIASFKTKVNLMDDREAKEFLEKGNDVTSGWYCLSLGKQQNLALSTAGIELKHHAVTLICTYCMELGFEFEPYVEQVRTIMIDALKKTVFTSIKTAAAECLPHLLSCVRNRESLCELTNEFIQELCQACFNESEYDVRSELIGSMSECTDKFFFRAENEFNNLRECALKLEVYDLLLSTLVSKLDGYVNCGDRGEPRSVELIKISDCVHVLFRYLKNDFLGRFKQDFLPIYLSLLTSNQPSYNRQWSLCCYGDVISYCGLGAALDIAPNIVPYIAPMIQDEHPNSRQASSYIIGLLALDVAPHNEEIKRFVQSCIPALQSAATGPQRHSAMNLMATENAVSAIGKILLADLAPNRSSLLSEWIQYLPIWADSEECEHVYSFLCELIDRRDPVAMGGQDEPNLPYLIRLIAECLLREGIDRKENTIKKVARLFEKLSRGEQAQWNSCLAVLNDRHKTAIDQAVVDASLVANKDQWEHQRK